MVPIKNSIITISKPNKILISNNVPSYEDFFEDFLTVFLFAVFFFTVLLFTVFLFAVLLVITSTPHTT